MEISMRATGAGHGNCLIVDQAEVQDVERRKEFTQNDVHAQPFLRPSDGMKM
jgi:hypothetical protein